MFSFEQCSRHIWPNYSYSSVVNTSSKNSNFSTTCEGSSTVIFGQINFIAFPVLYLHAKAIVFCNSLNPNKYALLSNHRGSSKNRKKKKMKINTCYGL